MDSHKLKLVSLGRDRIIAIGAIGLGVAAVAVLYINKSYNNNTVHAEEEVLASYQSLTGEEDMERSIQVLRNSNWDLQRAISGGSTPGAPSTPSASRPNTSVQRRQPIATGFILWPFSLAYRLVRFPFSVTYTVGNWMWRFGSGFVGSMIYGGGAGAVQNNNNNRDIDPATESARFIQFLESRFGNHHPNFLTGTYLQAVERAKAECKLLVIYLHCELNDNAANFCRNTLCTEVVESFINDNFVTWGSNIKYPQGYHVNEILGATGYPYIAVLCCNPVGELSSSNVGIVDRIEGMLTTDDLIARLYTSLEGFGTLLNNVRAERTRRETDRLLRDEQDAAYRQSLLEDQEKERRLREEQERTEREERERVEREEREEKERLEREQAKSRARDIRRRNLPLESTEKDSVMLMVKLPDGNQVRRKFRTSDKVQTVLDFVDCSQPEGGELYEFAEDYVLVSSFPRKVFSEPNQTLQDAGLTVSSSLFVELK